MRSSEQFMNDLTKALEEFSGSLEVHFWDGWFDVQLIMRPNPGKTMGTVVPPSTRLFTARDKVLAGALDQVLFDARNWGYLP